MVILIGYLYEKHNYLNKDIPCLINTTIREYDMKAGGYSILKKYGVLSEKEIQYLDNCDKLKRNIYLGNLLKNKPELSELQMQGFIEARQLFFEYNQINENNILAIKKDAIFIIKDIMHVTEFDGYKFQLANTYNSYYLLNDNTIELYYKTKTNEIDIKGINNEKLKLHENYILKDLKIIFSLAEKGNMDYLIKHLKKYRDKYLRRELNINTYRELNIESMFRLKETLAGEPLLIENINDIDSIDISYNYIKYIIPLISYYL